MTTASSSDPEPVRVVSDVETLRALADPIRLSILSALMDRSGQELPVMTVKELAADLGEPQTKLYRHVKQLELVGLIKAVASRVVSGIVEQRYQALQTDLRLGGKLTKTAEGRDAAEATVAAAFDLYRTEFFAAYRADVDAGRDDRSILNVTKVKIAATQAESIRQRLKQIVDDVVAAEQAVTDDDAVSVNLLIGFFSPDPRANS